jgi:hypothetical protein
MAYGARRRPNDGIHRVREGETISSIAAMYGFTDWEDRVWNAPENAALKEQRVNPNTLEKGDEVFIPELEEKQESRPVDDWHDFHVVRNKRFLRLKLEDENDKPLANKKYEIRTLSTLRGTYQQQGETTDADGFINEEIPHTLTEADLIVEEAKIHVRLKIGSLLPLPTNGPVKLEVAGTDVGGTLTNVGQGGDRALAGAGSAAGQIPGGIGDAVGGAVGGAQDAWDSVKQGASELFDQVAAGVSAAAPMVNAFSNMIGLGNLLEVENKNIPAAAQRLESMGYDCGKPAKGKPDMQFTAAVVEFQAWCKKQGLMSGGAGGLAGAASNPWAAAALSAVGLTGNLDAETIEAIKKAHGC